MGNAREISRRALCLNWRLGNLDAERCSSKREPCYAAYLLRPECLMDWLWRPMDGAWLGNCGGPHGDYDRRTTVDTCGVEYRSLYVAPVRPEGSLASRL